MESVWSNSVELKKFPQLNGDAKTDVLIIGGGLAGLLCAHFLKQRGVSYILAEAKTICSGVTKNTTAKITAQHGLIYDKLLKGAGFEKAQQYLNSNLLAIDKFNQLCQNIDCDLITLPSYVYSTKSVKKLEAEVKAVNRLGFNAAYEKHLEIPVKVVGAVKFNNQAQFNPLKFVSQICEGLNIFENTFVKKVEDGVATYERGKIKARCIIVATHFPFINRYGLYFMKMYQHRSYALGLENAQRLNGMYVDEAQNGLSFRPYNDLLILGGGDHRTGKNGGCWNELRRFKKENYHTASEKFHWATQDCMSLDSVPYIGEYSALTPNLLVATGFNKWGMTASMVAAMILADKALGIKNEFEDVFKPQRSMLKPQLLLNLLETTVNLATPVPKRCSHLGCALHWNKHERTWDCACHGSRFSSKGKLIDNPAMKNIRITR